MGESMLTELRGRFGIPGVARVEAGEGGLAKVAIASSSASAEVYLHGAQVTSWQPKGAQQVLFLSRQSAFAEGRAIRGGIPVCFPWFRAKQDDAKAPSHGVVRTRSWELAEVEKNGDEVSVTLSTGSDEATLKWWPFAYRVEHRITVGAALRLQLTVINTGEETMRFEEALHTYFAVGDVTRAQVVGLGGATYLDNVDGNSVKTQQGEIIFTGPTDNVYLDTPEPLELVDPVLGRRIRTTKENSATTVVWNPWEQGAAALNDLGDDEWRTMACVEACNIREAAVSLAPGARHRMASVITLQA